MRKTIQTALLAGALTATVLPMQTAGAAVLLVNLTGIQTFDAFQDTSNIVQLYNIGAGSRVTAVSYDVTITTIGASYLSEASIYYTNSAVTAGVVTRPGFANANSGTGTYVSSSDLVALALDFVVGADGILRVEYAESFDDNPNLPDATFTRGSISFTYTPATVTAVPEPMTWAMMIGGFGLVGGALRRRRAVTSVTTTAIA